MYHVRLKSTETSKKRITRKRSYQLMQWKTKQERKQRPWQTFIIFEERNFIQINSKPLELEIRFKTWKQVVPDTRSLRLKNYSTFVQSDTSKTSPLSCWFQRKNLFPQARFDESFAPLTQTVGIEIQIHAQSFAHPPICLPKPLEKQPNDKSGFYKTLYKTKALTNKAFLWLL